MKTHNQKAQDEACSMRDFFMEQQAWSYQTFGPPDFKGPQGPLDHLQKEVLEAIHANGQHHQRVEIVDCLFLVFDAAHRAGMDYGELARLAHEKLRINQQRVWPDWRGTDPNKAIEHDRSKDKPS